MECSRFKENSFVAADEPGRSRSSEKKTAFVYQITPSDYASILVWTEVSFRSKIQNVFFSYI